MSYDRNKTVVMNDILNGFLTFIDSNNLTLSEKLLIDYLWIHIKNELMESSDFYD